MLLLGEAGIISTSIEAILYGFSVLMFILTMWTLVRNRKVRPLNYAMITASCALLVLATSEMIVNIIRVCQGFLNIGPFLPGGPNQYFADVTQTTFIIKSCLFNTQTLILDGVVIYRTYVVWQSLYVVVVPLLGWLALFVCSVAANVALVTASGNASGDIFVAAGRWITAVYATTLATNLSATSLLAYRIWQVNRSSAQFKIGSRLSPVLRIVLDSGAIYSLTIIAAIITFEINSPGVYILLDMISPIISIVFYLIIIRVGFATDRRLPSIVGTLHQSAMLESGNAEGQPRGGYNRTGGYEMRAVTVEISKYSETDADSFTQADKDTKPQTVRGSVDPDPTSSSSASV